MAITYNSQEAKLEKKPTVFQNFMYDTESGGGCISKFGEANTLILDVSNDIEALCEKYNVLQNRYVKFTGFNDQMNSNKTSLRSSVDGIKKAFEEITKNLNNQVGALQKNDAALITDLEAINKLISSGKDQDKAIADSRSKTDAHSKSNSDGSTSTSGKSDEDISKAVDDVIKGKYGTGDERKEALKKAGFDPDEVQKKVNEKLNGGGSSSSATPSESTSPQSDTTSSNKPVDGQNGPKPSDNGEAGFAPSYSGVGLDPNSGVYKKIGGNTERLDAMIGYLKNKGLNNVQIAGVIGNSATESALQLEALSPSGAYKGLFQWEQARRPSNWDLNSQMDKMWEEYQTRSDRHGTTVAEHMAGVTTPEEATDMFRVYFEGGEGGQQERRDYAVDVYNYLNNYN